MLVGSVAKGTNLKDPDIDIFIQFSNRYEKKHVEKWGLEIAHSVIKNGYESYAEHPYLRGEVQGYRVDIVPCFRVENPSSRISSVDRTPFHTEFVKKHLSSEKRDDVRLLKAFMKGIGVYGAEAKVMGFSGYLCELLVIKYGSFLDVLHHASKWKRSVYLHLGNGGAKFKAPLVFIDPVDSGRNVASAVSEESKSMFILASKEFLKNPKIEFFFPNPTRALSKDNILSKLNERGTYIYAFIFRNPNVIDDVLYPQIRRTIKVFINILRDFLPVSSYYYVNEENVVILVELERDTLPEVVRHEGPTVWHANADNFLEKWKNVAIRGPYISGSRLYVDKRRKNVTVEEVIRKNIKNYKLGKLFEKQKNDIHLIKLEEAIDDLDLNKLSEFFIYRFPWER